MLALPRADICAEKPPEASPSAHDDDLAARVARVALAARADLTVLVDRAVQIDVGGTHQAGFKLSYEY